MQYILFDGHSATDASDWFEELHELDESVKDVELWDIAEAISVEHGHDPNYDHIGWERLSAAEAEEWKNQM